MSPQQEAAAIFIQTFNALARINGKRLSGKQCAALERACDLLGLAGAELDEVFEDLPTMPRMRAASETDMDEGFEQARRRREERERAEARRG